MKDVVLYGPTGHLIKKTVEPASREMRALERIMKRSGFKSAESNRGNADWVASNEPINTILSRQLKTLRARSRWLEMNNPYMIGAINQILNYCVGTGFSLQMNVKRTERDAAGNPVAVENDAFNDFVEDLFDEWSVDVVKQSSRTSPESFNDSTHLVVRRFLVDGEVFAHPVYDKRNGTVPLYLELIDADNLATNVTEWKGNPVVLGVEVDRDTWEPVAYWFHTTKKQHPARPSKVNAMRVPAERIIHVFRKMFPYQLRGVPFGAGVSERFFKVDAYDSAQLQRNRIAASFGLLLKNGAGTGGFPGMSNAEEGESLDENGFPVDIDGNPIANIVPGMMGKLPKGVEPFMINPTSPENSYAPFLDAQLTAIGAGVQFGLSATSMTRDHSKTTFAGGTLDENSDFQAFRVLMQFVSARYCTGVFRSWFDAAVLSGAITAPGYEVRPEFWRRHLWMPAGWERGINPLQRATARKVSMAAGMTTLADECAFEGRDWRSVALKEAKIKRFRESIGLDGRPYATKDANPQDAATLEAEMELTNV